jgi:thiamine pyrophosphate-dependent acetolactate synthase large subunit-like protein
LEESHIRNDLNVIPVICDVRYVLSELLKTKNLRVRESWKTKKSFNEQFHIVKEWNMTSALQCIFKEVANPIIFCDDGTYTIKTLQLFRPLQPRTLLFSGNMATGGYALSGAIGAKLAKKSRKVVVITGDGGLLSTIGELQVYAENKLKILIVVFNNGGYDSINQWSQIYKVPLDSNFDHVDFTTIAKGFGIEAYTINNLENSENVLRNYKWNEPLLLNLIVPSEQVNCHFPI